jgi:hypothetical protein
MPKSQKQPTQSNDNYRSIAPLQELRFLDVLMKDKRLSTTARAIGFHLIRWTNGDRTHRLYGCAWVSRQKLADVIGRSSKTTITTATNALAEYGYFTFQRRNNNTSLARPNWDKVEQVASDVAGNRKDVPVEGQKSAFPVNQETGLPAVQEVGLYSADSDSSDRDSESFPDASRREYEKFSSEETVLPTGPSAFATKPGYKQTKAEAEQTWRWLCEIWPQQCDDEFRPSERSEQGAKVRYHRYLRAGISTTRVRRAALAYLDNLDGLWPCSLSSFFDKYLEDYVVLEPSVPERYIPPDDEPMSANDNLRYGAAAGGRPRSFRAP